MYLGSGENEIGPLTTETVVEALERCGHRCEHGASGLIIVHAKDGTSWYPIFPDPANPATFPPETLAYICKQLKVSVFDFARSVIDIVNPMPEADD